MSSIFSLNKENAAFTYAIRRAMPFQGFLFNYNIENKPEGRSKVVHVVRSAITITACSCFILAALVEKAVRATFSLIKKGIDKVLTQKQQQNIKDKAGETAGKAKDAGKGFFNRHFGSLFGKTS